MIRHIRRQVRIDAVGLGKAVVRQPLGQSAGPCAASRHRVR
jgi:hypothetical protein